MKGQRVFVYFDPNSDALQEPHRAQPKTFKPRGVEINRNGTFEEKCAWMRAKQAGLIKLGRKKKR